jgi:hypothetical protein
MTYGKKLTSSVKMDSVWGPVLYCNFLSIVPMFMLAYYQGDLFGVFTLLNNLPFNGVAVLIFSCITGTLIGYYITVTRKHIYRNFLASYFLSLTNFVCVFFVV